MSSTQSGEFEREPDDLREVLRALQSWLDSQSQRVVLVPRAARELPEFPAADVARALARLSESGQLHRVYCVRTPDSQTVLRQTFKRIEDIPDQLRDALNRPFSIDDAEVEPAYELEGV